jgi:hypothetical protein
MIKFRTEVDIPEFVKKMGYRHQSMMIGSCFAENTGDYLQDHCLPVMVNPFGILYNPISIANSLEMLITRKKFTETDLFYHNGLHNSFFHHSRFSRSSLADMLELINLQAEEGFNCLKNSSHLFITFGTSWVFEHRETGNVVSNCHKLPSSTFDRYRLSIEQITERWIPLIGQLKKINPDLQIVFTVSPIRHLNDGAHGNQLSKAILLMATDALIARFENDSVAYFPSYELVLDELRDYRFYASDMTHPSDVAIAFIREKYSSKLFDYEAITLLSEIEKLHSALIHKPFNSKETGYISFIESQISKVNQLKQQYPFVNFNKLANKFHEKIPL